MLGTDQGGSERLLHICDALVLLCVNLVQLDDVSQNPLLCMIRLRGGREIGARFGKRKWSSSHGSGEVVVV